MSAAPLDVVRTSAAGAAAVLAVLSRGDVLVLAALLVVVAWRPAAVAVVPALVASAWRWGSTSLDAVAGAQAVLGPAALVGPTSAAVASLSAALAILAGVPGRSLDGASPNRGPRGAQLMVAMATGAAVAAVVAGPGVGGEIWVRVVVGAVASVGAAGVARLRTRGDSVGRVLDGGAALAALVACIAASRAAPAWTGTVDSGAVGEGVVVALAVVIVGVVGTRTVAAMPERGV